MPALALVLVIQLLPLEDEYVFFASPDRAVALFRGDSCIMGKLNARGEFSESSRLHKTAPGSVRGEIINWVGKKPIPVYEYRSGRLILGVMDTEGYFVPDLDSKVIDFKDYRYKPGGIFVYNLPGEFAKKKP